jgi:hypothetical protein
VKIAVDTRERYPYRFVQQGAETVRATVSAGDYAIHSPERRQLAAVERKSLDNLASTLSDGTLAFQLQRLAELPLAAVVVEARYAALFKLAHVNGDWLADQLARLEVRYPEVTIVFADSRRYAEDWTYRFLATALADTTDPTRTPNTLHVDWRRLPVPREITICEPYTLTRLGELAQRVQGQPPLNRGAFFTQRASR